MRQKFWELGGSRMMAAMRVKEVKEGCDTTDTGISDDVKVEEQEEGDDGGEVDYRWVYTWFNFSLHDDLRSFVALISIVVIHTKENQRHLLRTCRNWVGRPIRLYRNLLGQSRYVNSGSIYRHLPSENPCFKS